MTEEVDDYVEIIKWHDDYQPDPHPKSEDITSGLRATTAPCQYWVKGLPIICKHFDESAKCNVSDATGYNNGNCDYLGRRSWCSHYSCGETMTVATEEYICIAPDMFRTGLGKRDMSFTEFLVKIPYTRDEILGYNNKDSVGRCDGRGMGRGAAGFAGVEELETAGNTDSDIAEELYKLPVVCRHYKPYIMGFGAIKPRPMGESVLHGEDIYDGTSADPLSSLTRYLPLIFHMYNMRARSKKCAYWDQDFGVDFEMDYSGGYASIVLSEDPLTECTCEEKECEPYKTITDEWLPNTSDTLMDVLTKEKGIVCNGAKPECPCYTSKWKYCVDKKMRDGMRITAEQIMELRFYIAAWQTKERYDSLFEEKPGTSGNTTSDIFTFDKWEKLGSKVEDSIMKGKRIYQCFPVPLNNAEFDADVYLTKDSIIYPKAQFEKGTLGENESSFPTLVRDISTDFDIPPLDVIFPYVSEDPWSEAPCAEKGIEEIGTMPFASCRLENPEITTFGYTVMEKIVYVINTTGAGFGGILNEYREKRISTLDKKIRKEANALIEGIIHSCFKDTRLLKYAATSISNQYGYFSVGPVQLKYGCENELVIICMWTPSEYEVVFRGVEPTLYGAYIVQSGFDFKYERDVS